MAEKKKGNAKKKAHEYYSVSGEEAKAKNRQCPKCGAGTFLAQHGNRESCGKCGYTEWKQK